MADRVDTLLEQMTLDEKVALLAGEDLWHVPAISRLGIPRLKMSDGPVGVRGAYNTGGPRSACFPCATALAATWDAELIGRVGAALGREAKAKGAHVHLAPTVNIHRTPLAGRNFECFSEDPHLTARMAVAYVTGVQSEGVGSCIKHFVANDSEFERMSISSEVPERALREIYLAPFEAAVTEAGAWSIMSAYNRLHGTYCSESEALLTTILRDEWGFDGAVVSDWTGTHSTVEAIDAGLDVEMPGPPRYRGSQLVDAVKAGEVGEDAVDRAARAVLHLAQRTGSLDQEEEVDEGEADTAETRALAREVAARAMVLLRNEPVAGTPVLPIDTGAVRTIAVIGPNAATAQVLGGGSAQVTPYYTVSPLEGLRAALGDGVEIVHEPGCSIHRTSAPRIDPRHVSADGGPGFLMEYFAGRDLAGEPVVRRVLSRSTFAWWGSPAPGIDPAAWSARVSGTFRAETSAPHTFQTRVPRGSSVRLMVDGEVLIDSARTEPGSDPRGARLEGTVDLAAGDERALEVEFVPPSGGFALPSGLDLRCRVPVPDDLMERAVGAAAGADVAIVVVGMNSDWETEGRDRETMDLPGAQDELIERVVAANPRTVVVVNTGAPVRMDWADAVPAIVQIWYPGMEAGNALADVLLGAVDASGRLPTTFPRRLSDVPAMLNYPGEFGRVVYGEGLFVGYRGFEKLGVGPRFPFGHGLSYTSFEYGDATVEDDGTGVIVTVEVANTGGRVGRDVVQIYLADVESSMHRPLKELTGFAVVDLEPGERATARVRLEPRAFQIWDPTLHRWREEPGDYDVLVGRSSADIRSSVRLARPSA